MSDRIEWMHRPEDHDFDAARDFLELLYRPVDAAGLVSKLRMAPMVRKKAKDILRAAGLPLLGRDDSEVAAALSKIHHGEKVSPILLCRSVRGLIVADGYHRVCAAYHLSDDTEVHAHLI
jgi:hypothetical protein